MTAPIWKVSNRPGQRRVPIRVKRHSRFVGGFTVSLIGTRWSRTWGLLPAGTEMYATGNPSWLGGMSWTTNVSRRGPLTRPALALCKWRYR